MKHCLYNPFLVAEANKLKRIDGTYTELSHKTIKLMTRNERIAYVAAFNLYKEKQSVSIITALRYEWVLHAQGNPTIFIDTPLLIDTLIKSKFYISHDSIVLPNKMSVSYFSFPKGYIVNDVELQGCFFGMEDYEKESKAFSLLNKICRVNVTVNGILDRGAENHMFFIGIRDVEGRLYWTSLRRHELQNALNNGIQHFIHNNGQMSKDEVIFSDTHFKICAAACIYAQAFPENVRKGFPESARMKEKDLKNTDLRPITLCFPTEKNGGSKCMHLRRGHFRSLVNERYARNEDGSIKVVFVRESVINGVVDPTTVLERKSNEETGAGD